MAAEPDGREGASHGRLAGSSPHGMLAIAAAAPVRRSRRVADGGTVRLVAVLHCCDYTLLLWQFCMSVDGLRSAGYVRAVPQPLPRNRRLREQALDAAKLDRIVARPDELERGSRRVRRPGVIRAAARVAGRCPSYGRRDGGHRPGEGVARQGTPAETQSVPNQCPNDKELGLEGKPNPRREGAAIPVGMPLRANQRPPIARALKQSGGLEVPSSNLGAPTNEKRCKCSAFVSLERVSVDPLVTQTEHNARLDSYSFSRASTARRASTIAAMRATRRFRSALPNGGMLCGSVT